jgi:glycosyltransferase involved in cell wall biosynthesis
VPRIGFVSFEIYPTNRGGCGVLLHHAAELLLRRGYEVSFLLDVPADEFARFDQQDRLGLTHAEHCRAWHVDALCADFPYRETQINDHFRWNSLRFAHALEAWLRQEQLDAAEFVDYCGVAYDALVARLFAAEPADGPVLGVRLHSTLEVLDFHGSTNQLDRTRYGMYGLEHGSLRLAEAVLTPTQRYFDAEYAARYGVAADKVVVAQSPKLDFPRVVRRPSGDGPYSIVFFGRLFNMKGVDQFVHAACVLLRRRPHLPVRFELIGYDGAESPFGRSYGEYLRSLIPAEHQSRFEFCGQLAHDEVQARLNDTLCAVFPNRLESFCYALHEVYDAGVPVIVNNLPAFTDFFHHEQNALVYDGTTEGLVAALERLLDAPDLRERLCRPYPVATEPLGSFYDRPQALAPLISATPAAKLSPTVMILAPEDGAALDRTRAALAAQTRDDFRVLTFVADTSPAAEHFWWLGRPGELRDPDGTVLSGVDAVTTDTLVLLQAGDIPQPDWLATCCRPLQRRTDLAFAGTWSTAAGVLATCDLDVVPEAYPFERGAARTRMLVRTEPGRLLMDLFDTNLGHLGEIGYLWQAIARWGPGVILPRPLLAAADGPAEIPDANLLNYLVARHGGPFAARLRLYSGILHGRVLAHAQAATGMSVVLPSVSVAQKRKYAAELSGRDLAGIIARKAAARLRGGVYDG